MKCYKLYVETDYDFSIMHKGELYCDHSFEIVLESVKELDDIEVLGPYGEKLTSSTKCFEYLEAVGRIKNFPDEPLDNTGGKRGVTWTPINAMDHILAKLPPEFQSYVSSEAWDRGHSAGESEVISIAKEMAHDLEAVIRKYTNRILNL